MLCISLLCIWEKLKTFLEYNCLVQGLYQCSCIPACIHAALYNEVQKQFYIIISKRHYMVIEGGIASLSVMQSHAYFG